MDHQKICITDKEFDLLSEEQSKEYPELYFITAHNRNTATKCPYCGSEHLSKKDSGKKDIFDYDLSRERVNSIRVFSQRYRCEAPDCGRTFTAEHGLGSLLHTRAFDRHVALKLIKDTSLSNSSLSERYHISRPIIGDCVHAFVTDLNLYYLPSLSSTLLYLRPFLYQKKKRYYLAGIDCTGKRTMLAFFGYDDADEELRNYLAFLKRYLEETGKTSIMTDMSLELIESIKSLLCNAEISIIPQLLDKRLDSFKVDYGDGSYGAKCNALHKLSALLHSDNCSIEKLNDWWDGVCQNQDVRSALEPLWNIMTKCQKELFRKQDLETAYFTSIDETISTCNKNKTPFDIMAARFMYKSYGECIFEEQGIFDINGISNYDAENNIVYRTAWSPQHKEPLYIAYRDDCDFRPADLMSVSVPLPSKRKRSRQK